MKSPAERVQEMIKALNKIKESAHVLYEQDCLMAANFAKSMGGVQ
jgi:hypothetical protein